jgi:hypothetical protein
MEHSSPLRVIEYSLLADIKDRVRIVRDSYQEEMVDQARNMEQKVERKN